MITKILNDAWIFIQIIIGYNLVVPAILFLVYIIKGKKRISPAKSNSSHDYAIIVTAYEQTDTLPPVIDSILKMNYEHYIVYIVADKCDISALKFDDERVV